MNQHLKKHLNQTPATASGKAPEPPTEKAPAPTPKPRANVKVFDTLKRKISPLKLREEVLNEIENEEKHMNNEVRLTLGIILHHVQ